MLGVLWGLFITTIFTIVLFLISPFLGILWVVALVVMAVVTIKKHK